MLATAKALSGDMTELEIETRIIDIEQSYDEQMAALEELRTSFDDLSQDMDDSAIPLQMRDDDSLVISIDRARQQFNTEYALHTRKG